MSRPYRTLGALFWGLAACSTSPSPSPANSPAPMGSDDAGGLGVDDSSAPPVQEGSAPPAQEASAMPPVGDAGDGGSSDAPSLPVADMAAGKAGADAFCNQICSHEQHCAAVLDASPAGLTNCVSDCQSANESPTTSPPTELLRADYVSALGACIAGSSCSEALETSEMNCAAGLLSGSAEAGSPPLKPTAAVAGLCHELETSPCVAADSGVQNCETAFMFFSDQALNAAIACFSSPSCAQAASCYVAALMQM